MLIFELLAKCTNVTGLSKDCVIQVADTGSFITVSFQCLTLESSYLDFDSHIKTKRLGSISKAYTKHKMGLLLHSA
ncbi:hypothetical protein [Wolbachia endosymbiont (group A) of Cheilosia soror]|uniref:hypothetical protein n=1 Tax=Wolbachia endosymbiont (group A) of Cheilosia soror TaxID=2953995 RepID=UPI0021F917A8|nr:hypothetical protein [Wolbachia endosymbiont (group A) of Cheilosia soror]